MVCDKRIKYLDYCENGERVRGCGFARLEVRNGSLQMELKATGLPSTDSFTRDVLLRGEKREFIIGQIDISGGRGQWQYLCREPDNVGGEGISYEELRGLRVPLEAGREISCSWKPQSMTAREQQEMEKSTGREQGAAWSWMVFPASKESAYVGREGKGMEEPAGAEDIRERMPESTGTEGTRQRAEKPVSTGKAGKRMSGREESTGERAEEPGREENTGDRAEERARMESMGEGVKELTGAENAKERPAKAEEAVGPWGHLATGRDGGKSKPDAKPMVQMEDKWAQLCAIYPHIRPFRDEREYLSIGPSDFVLFPSASYKAVNNSFLLHGYYNYHHLLLAKVERKGEYHYYIGVPGNYFEREKQVAIMFGFESFECAEEPAQPGDFGYYMMRTEL